MNKDTMIPAHAIYCDLIRRALEERDKTTALRRSGESTDLVPLTQAIGAEAAFTEASKLVRQLAADAMADQQEHKLREFWIHEGLCEVREIGEELPDAGHWFKVRETEADT